MEYKVESSRAVLPLLCGEQERFPSKNKKCYFVHSENVAIPLIDFLWAYEGEESSEPNKVFSIAIDDFALWLGILLEKVGGVLPDKSSRYYFTSESDHNFELELCWTGEELLLDIAVSKKGDIIIDESWNITLSNWALTDHSVTAMLKQTLARLATLY